MATRKHVYRKADGTRWKRVPVSYLKPEDEFFLVGSNVGAFHFFDGWYLAYLPSKETREERTIAFIINEFNFYLEPELGRYTIAYRRIK